MSTNLLAFVFVLLFVLLMAFQAVRLTRGKKATLRLLTAFAQLGKSIGASVESGKGLHVSIGHGGLEGAKGASALVGFSVLNRLSRVASVSDKPPVITSGESALAILAQDTLRTVLREIGEREQFDPYASQVSGLTPLSYVAGALPRVLDKEVSLNVLIGHLGSEALLLTDAAERMGSMSLAGSDDLAGQAVLYASATQPLIGEELFASGAYLGAGRGHIASLFTQDVFRWIIIVLILLGAMLKFLGFI